MPTTTTDTVLVGELVNLFLDSKSAAPSPKRYKITKRFLREFARSFGAMPVAALRVGGIEKIERWLDAHTNWNGCRPDVVGRIRRLFNWSAQQGYIPSSPVAALKKPRYNVRVSTFNPEQIAAILAHANDFFARGFRMLLLTGCRPDEICSLTHDDVHEDGSGLYLLVAHKNQRHTGTKRRVFLVPEAQAMIREQLKKYPTGRLFRSANKTKNGVRPPLSPEYFGNALRKICRKPECRKLGLDDHKLVGATKKGKSKRQYKFVAYTTRHTFAVRYLTGFYKDAKGQQIILNYGEVAALLGNTAKMVEQIYGHLVDQTAFLTNRLNGTFGT